MATAEKYVSSLKQIKEAEESAQKEVEEQKKKLSADFKKFEANVREAIDAAKSDGEKLVESSIEQSRTKATAETEKIIADAESKAKTISTRIDTKTVQEIIDILLRGV